MKPVPPAELPFEARMLAADFVQAIDDRHRAWEQRTGPGEWATEDDAPDPCHASLVAWFPGS